MKYYQQVLRNSGMYITHQEFASLPGKSLSLLHYRFGAPLLFLFSIRVLKTCGSNFSSQV